MDHAVADVLSTHLNARSLARLQTTSRNMSALAARAGRTQDIRNAKAARALEKVREDILWLNRQLKDTLHIHEQVSVHARKGPFERDGLRDALDRKQVVLLLGLSWNYDNAPYEPEDAESNSESHEDFYEYVAWELALPAMVRMARHLGYLEVRRPMTVEDIFNESSIVAYKPLREPLADLEVVYQVLFYTISDRRRRRFGSIKLHISPDRGDARIETQFTD